MGLCNDGAMVFGYARVSTDEQDTKAQERALNAAGGLRQVVSGIGFFAHIACIRLSLKQLAVELKLNTNSL